MYGIVLLMALTSADESAGMGRRGYPTPSYGSGWTSGQHGLNGGYHWAGYACYGGCGGYHSPAYGVPMTPIVLPSPYVPEPVIDNKKDDKTKKAPAGAGEGDDEDNKPKKGTPKKKPADDDSSAAAAVITIFLPPGAKGDIDGRPIVGGVRSFVTPPLKKGGEYWYDVNIETKRDGKPVTVTKQVRLTAGESVHADYRDLRELVATKAEPPKTQVPASNNAKPVEGRR